MNTIKSILYYIFVAILLIYITLLLISPNKIMDVFGFRAFVVVSNSMEPVINVNDLIISKEIEESELEVGDIITFNIYISEVDEVSVVTHYIADIETIGETTIYQTQGAHQADGIYDKWVDDDGYRIFVTYEDIEGEYLFKIPYLGYVIDIISNRTFIFLVVLNGSVIYLLFKYIKTSKDDENEQKDQ